MNRIVYLLALTFLASCSTAYLKHPAYLEARSLPREYNKVRSAVRSATKAQLDSSDRANALADTALLATRRALRNSVQSIIRSNGWCESQLEKLSEIQLEYAMTLPKYDEGHSALIFMNLLDAKRDGKACVRAFNESQNVEGVREARKLLTAFRQSSKKLHLRAFEEYRYRQGESGSSSLDLHLLISGTQELYGDIIPAMEGSYNAYLSLVKTYHLILETLPCSMKYYAQ